MLSFPYLFVYLAYNVYVLNSDHGLMQGILVQKSNMEEHSKHTFLYWEKVKCNSFLVTLNV